MWKLYDDLYIGIPSGIRIDSCIVGKCWTAVCANGNVGIAKTLGMPDNPKEFAASFTGAWLRETAGHIKWGNLAQASVGVAAMNAWYNTKERAEALDGLSSPAPLAGKTAYVGDYRAENAFPLPMSPDFDAAAYKSLSGFEVVVVAGEALTTRALPKLFDLAGKNTGFVIDGLSVPCAPVFFAFDMPVRELRGFYPGILNSFIECADRDIENPAFAQPFTIRLEAIKKIQEDARQHRW